MKKAKKAKPSSPPTSPKSPQVVEHQVSERPGSSAELRARLWFFTVAFGLVGLAFLWQGYVRFFAKPTKPFGRVKGKIEREPELRIVGGFPSRERAAERGEGPKNSKPALAVVPTFGGLQKALRHLDQAMVKQAIPMGRFADGGRLLGLPIEKASDPAHPHEKPRGTHLWKVTKDGRYEKLAFEKAVSGAKIAPESGTILAVTPERELFVSKEGGGPPFVEVAKNVDYHPAFSADGRALVYSRQVQMDEHEVFVRDLQKGTTRRLFQADASTPVFSPKGDALVYTSNRSGWYSLWKYPLPDGPPVQLTNRGLPVGQGLPGGFVPTPINGRILWGGSWLVFDAGSGLWAVREDGEKAFRIEGSPLWFEWATPGRLLRYAITEGSEQVYTFP